MPDKRDYPDLEHIAGYAGGKPEVKDGRDGEFTTFRLGVTRTYDRDVDDATTWYGVSVNKPELQEFVQERLSKGMAVVCEGSAYTSKSKGVEYHNFRAFRVGIIDWFVVGDKPKKRDEVDEDL